jgi:putative oxidoreductase
LAGFQVITIGRFCVIAEALCALLLVIDMIVAVASNRIHSIQATGVLAWLDDFLYLPEVLYVIILVWLIFSGPGRFSLDALITRRRVRRTGDGA